MPEDDRLKFPPQEPQQPVVAQFNPDLGGWEILVNDQWVSISHLIDSIVEMRTILESTDKNHLP